MHSNGAILSSTLRAFEKFRHSEQQRIVAHSYLPVLTCQNELLFLLKPEITSLPFTDFRQITELIADLFSQFAVSITSSLVLSGRYLDTFGLMERHYGVINQIARQGVVALSDAAKLTFQQLFGQSPQEAIVLGGFQFLHRFPQFDPDSLHNFWVQGKSSKLGGGTYCQNVTVGGTSVYLLNGFYPYQLERFVRPETALVVFTIQANTPWSSLRDEMLGATNPAAATGGSLRSVLLEGKERYGLSEVGQGYNCAHLSAGPLEAIGEIARLLPDYTHGNRLSVADIALGKWLCGNGLDCGFLHDLLQNPMISFDGKLTSPFELTEGIDARCCLGFLLARHDHLRSSIYTAAKEQSISARSRQY